jgi:hypothetical protein
MNKAAFLRWARDPTTINGVGLAIGGVAAAVAHALTGQTTWIVAAGLGAGALYHVAVPSDQGASSVEKLMRDAAQAAVEHHLAQAMPSLLADAMTAVDAFGHPAAPPLASAPLPENLTKQG